MAREGRVQAWLEVLPCQRLLLSSLHTFEATRTAPFIQMRLVFKTEPYDYLDGVQVILKPTVMTAMKASIWNWI